MKIIIDTSWIGTMHTDNYHGGEKYFAATSHGNDFFLHVPHLGGIEFDSPEEAEDIAGAILSGLAQAKLPRRD